MLLLLNGILKIYVYETFKYSFLLRFLIFKIIHKMTNKKCVLCKREGVMDEFGNNAQPIKEGMCCEYCNNTYVIPERLRRLKLGIKFEK